MDPFAAMTSRLSGHDLCIRDDRTCSGISYQNNPVANKRRSRYDCSELKKWGKGVIQPDIPLGLTRRGACLDFTDMVKYGEDLK